MRSNRLFRSAVVLAVTALAAVLLTSCGSDDDSDLEAQIAALEEENAQLKDAADSGETADVEETTTTTTTAAPAPTEAPTTSTTTVVEPPTTTEAEPETGVVAAPEEAGEDCIDVKDRTALSIDSENPSPISISNSVVNPGDPCDFYLVTVTGLNQNRSATITFQVGCSDESVARINLDGAGSLRYESNPSADYRCGESWTETYRYQSYNSSFVVWIPQAREAAVSYQLTGVVVVG